MIHKRSIQILRDIVVSAGVALGCISRSVANPTGLTVKAGSASTHASGSQLTVNTGNLAVLNWSSFNILSGETTTFVQPSPNAVVFNLIGGASASQIYGNLNANGTVILANSHGFYFGPNSFVNVGGNFIATTTPLPPDAGIGSSWEFTGTPPLASIVNYGQISAGQGHSLFLIAEDVENRGDLAAPGGNVGLCAGQDVLLSDQADGRGLSATVKLPSGSVDNTGRITANAGTIALNAEVVNQDGVIQADSFVNHNGTIELVAGGQVNLGPNSQILARGDDSASGSAGGNVTIKAGNTFSDTTGSQISATGGAHGGNGGNIEISAPNVASLNTSLDASAQPGSKAGQLSLDPENITLSTSIGSTAGSGTVSEGSAPTMGTLPLKISSLNAFSTIDLQASQNITLAGTWTVTSGAAPTSITLQAGNNITFNNGDSLIVQNGASVTLTAGASFGSATSVTPNTTASSSSITLTGGASIQSTSGNISLIAGGGITTGTGTITSGGGSILLQAAAQNIALGGKTWVLPDLGAGAPTSYVTLEAANNITFASGGGIFAGQGWTMNLAAGATSFSTSPTTPQTYTPATVNTTGTGSVTLSGSAYLQSETGDIDIIAANSVTVGSGNVTTVSGGNINVDAVAGSINAGTDNGLQNGGFQFVVSGVSLARTTAPDGNNFPDPGGISTAGGGNVNLTAGQDVISVPSTLPSGEAISTQVVNGVLGYAPGATGGYGSEPGDVTINAGRNIIGNFIVANGTGQLVAGGQVSGGQFTPNNNPLYQTPSIGNPASPVALSLISGTWSVWAANDIYLQEVRNPAGAFENFSLSVPAGEYGGDIGGATVPAKSTFLYNYAGNAAANLWAGDAITLTDDLLPYDTGYSRSTPVYPPQLSLTAGKDGITLQNDLVLFPSSQGSLKITTTGGGDLSGTFLPNELPTSLTMSDSGLPTYADFLAGQASSPLHLNDSTPVSLNISGDIDSLDLVAPTFAQINVTGNTYNFDFSGQNLSTTGTTSTTSINVGGSITYRGDTSSVQISTPLPAQLFDGFLIPATDQAATADLQYDSKTGTLTFHGAMTQQEEDYLLDPTVLVLNPFNKPIVGPNGQDITRQLTLTTDQQTAIKSLFAASQGAELGVGGLSISGPGHFVVNAGSIDMGTSAGITVTEGNAALTAISPKGADLTVTSTGALDLTSSKIANGSLLGGVDVIAGTSIDVGNQFTPFGDPSAATGIFTTSGGSISVTATAGDVNVDGSRITAYDGGNITIRSLTGDVDAGTGGTGDVNVQGEYLNSKTGQLVTFDDSIPGSGVMATALPHSPAPLGNIVIDTPQGSINASKGGIIQINLGGSSSKSASIDLTAGKDINASGSGVIGGNLEVNAAGNVTGVLVSAGTINLNAGLSANVTAFAKGDVSITASEGVSGTVMTSGSATVTGSTITASLISQSVSTSGSTTGSSIGVPQSNVAKEDAKVADDASTMASNTEDTDSNDDTKKNKTITLAQKAGRVHVILPGNKNAHL
jgi:filamentous hemagglutinin family protein